MKNQESKDFIAYEYLSLEVKNEKELLYLDCYENFGWKCIRSNILVDQEDYYINQTKNLKKSVFIKMKRDRRIPNKADLITLQRKMEFAFKQMERFERDPQIKGMITSLSIGMVGTIFMALSTFAITASSPFYIACVIFGSLGLLGWIFPYFVYQNVKIKKEKEIVPLIEEQYQVIFDCCEQAKQLLERTEDLFD